MKTLKSKDIKDFIETYNNQLFQDLAGYNKLLAKYEDLILITDSLDNFKSLFINLVNENEYILKLINSKKLAIVDLLNKNSHTISTSTSVRSEGINKNENNSTSKDTNNTINKSKNTTSDNNSFADPGLNYELTNFNANLLNSNLTIQDLTNENINSLLAKNEFTTNNNTYFVSSSLKDDIISVLNGLEIDNEVDKYLNKFSVLFTLNLFTKDEVKNVNVNLEIEEFFKNLNEQFLILKNSLISQLKDEVKTNIKEIENIKNKFDDILNNYQNKVSELYNKLIFGAKDDIKKQVNELFNLQLDELNKYLADILTTANNANETANNVDKRLGFIEDTKLKEMEQNISHNTDQIAISDSEIETVKNQIENMKWDILNNFDNLYLSEKYIKVKCNEVLPELIKATKDEFIDPKYLTFNTWLLYNTETFFTLKNKKGDKTYYFDVTFPGMNTTYIIVNDVYCLDSAGNWTTLEYLGVYFRYEVIREFKVYKKE